MIYAAGLLVGCVHHKQELTLRSDGTGELVVSYFFPNSTLEQINAYLDTDESPVSDPVLFDADVIPPPPP